jgi:hypothetical protein
MPRNKISLREWIKNNRSDLDVAIKRACPNIGSISDDDRRQWVLNDEGLYDWARGEGARVD